MPGMPIIAGALSAVCSPVSHSESGDGISGQDRPDREGILLRQLSLHVAERRNQALHFVSREEALSFRRRNRTNHVAAGVITPTNPLRFLLADTLGVGSASKRPAISENPGRPRAEDDPLTTYSIVSHLRCMLERRFDFVSCCDLALPAVMQRRSATDLARRGLAEGG
jgi:hypothetical protein